MYDGSLIYSPTSFQPRPMDETTALGSSALIPSGTNALRELSADPQRQAVASIHGTVYQAWVSIDAWLQLRNADEVIYLEGAEDFDVVRTGDCVAVQVKRQEGPISLGYQRARDALENYWKLATSEPARRVEMHYLTTGPVAIEHDADFDGLPGIEAWRAARTNDDLARRIAAYLSHKLPGASSLGAYLRTAPAAQVQERLFGRFHWFTEQPDTEAVKRSVFERIVVRLHADGRPAFLASKVRLHVESRFWEVVVLKPSSRRQLSFADLLLQIEEATTTYLPIPLHRVPDLLGNQSFGPGLLDLLLAKPARPPQPLLHRPALVKQVSALVQQRQAVLLTGTVHKGKTTTAQLVAAELCPTAWWLKLTGRRPDQVDTLLMAMASRVDSPGCPALVVLDDVDLSVGSINVFGSALELVVHRMRASGRAVLMTAQGTLVDGSSGHCGASVETVHIPELSQADIKDLCEDLGCPAEAAASWSRPIWLWTLGHPKLVQVRINELANRGWPSPRVEDLLGKSAAVSTARQLTRRLLSQSQPEPVARFLYTAAELTIPMDRALALHVAQTVPGLGNPGDVIDRLAGQWLEQEEHGLLRPTPLLKGAAADVWAQPELPAIHCKLHDAISSKGTLNQREAAALFFHAFMARDRKRMALTAAHLQVAVATNAQQRVFEQLSWLSVIALAPGETFTDDALADATIRSLQFQVAVLVDEAQLTGIAERWIEAVARIRGTKARVTSEALLWPTIGMSDRSGLGLGPRLAAASGMHLLQDAEFGLSELLREAALRATRSMADIPEQASPLQLVLLMTSCSVRDLDTLVALVCWLEREASDTLRAAFESLLSWPLTQRLGAFVHAAWAFCFEEVTDWAPWLAVFDRIRMYASRFSSPNFGREAAKATSVILAERLGRGDRALAALRDAENKFGPSAVLTEQKANVLFHTQDDQGVLDLWERLPNEPDSQAVLSPFVYRRVAMSAARLKRFGQAAETLLVGARSITPGEFAQTRFGLLVDAASAQSLDRQFSEAARTLTEAAAALPPAAYNDGEPRWEAVLRAAMDVCGQVEFRWSRKTWPHTEREPGYASAPTLKVAACEPNQRTRTEIFVVEALRLAASLGIVAGPTLESQVRRPPASDLALLRFLAAQARLALVLRDGATDEFVGSLTDFVRNYVEQAAQGQRQHALEPDDGRAMATSIQPQDWIGIMVAALCCSTRPAIETLEGWARECSRLTNEQHELAVLIDSAAAQLKEASDRPARIVSQVQGGVFVQCAAAKSLLEQPQSPSLTLKLQALLASGAVSGQSHHFQSLFNRHLAATFAPVWVAHAQRAFSLVSPRLSVPQLRSVCNQAADGRATLKELLGVAAMAAGQPLGNFAQHVW